jgi:hypothetical protein
MNTTKRRRPRSDSGQLARLGIEAGFLTAAERAFACGCSKTHMHHLERGAFLPGLDLVSRMGLTYAVTRAAVEAASRADIKARIKRGKKP